MYRRIFEMRRTTAMEISQFAQARIQLSDVVCIYIYHGCRAIKSASGRAENYPGRMWEDKCRHRSNHLRALGKFWHANNYVGLHRYTIHGTSSVRYGAAHASEQTLPVNISGMASTGQLEQRQVRCSHCCDFVEKELKNLWLIFDKYFCTYIFFNFLVNIDFIQIYIFCK